jgi:hypothetical protein
MSHRLLEEACMQVAGGRRRNCLDDGGRGDGDRSLVLVGGLSEHCARHGSYQLLEQRTHLDGLPGSEEFQGNQAPKQALLESGRSADLAGRDPGVQ